MMNRNILRIKVGEVLNWILLFNNEFVIMFNIIKWEKYKFILFIVKYEFYYRKNLFLMLF